MPARTLADLLRVATPAEVRRATREAETRGLPPSAITSHARRAAISRTTSSSRQAFRDDRDRDVELELLGFTVVRFDGSRLADDPAGIARDVLAVLAAAAP